jgi:hypothetical protein
MKQSYYRIFTVLFPKMGTKKKKMKLSQAIFSFLPGYFAVFLVLVSLLLLGGVLVLISGYTTTVHMRQTTQQQYQYWQRAVVSHPDYPDGYYKLAFYAYLLGEKSQAQSSIQHALTLDPRFEEAKRLEKKINDL